MKPQPLGAMKFLMTILLAFVVSSAKSQGINVGGLEQIAFRYLVDSVLCLKYPAASIFYVRDVIDNQLSQLRHGTGDWKEYSLPLDSSQAREIEVEKVAIGHSKIEHLTLPNVSCRQLQLIKTINKTSQSKNTYNIRVHKRCPGRQGRYFVETVVYGQEGRTHYFFELDPSTEVVKRWYQANYYY